MASTDQQLRELMSSLPTPWPASDALVNRWTGQWADRYTTVALGHTIFQPRLHECLTRDVSAAAYRFLDMDRSPPN